MGLVERDTPLLFNISLISDHKRKQRRRNIWITCLSITKTKAYISSTLWLKAKRNRTVHREIRNTKLWELTACAASSIITTSKPRFHLLKRVEPLKLRVEKTCQSYINQKGNYICFHFYHEEKVTYDHSLVQNCRTDTVLISSWSSVFLFTSIHAFLFLFHLQNALFMSPLYVP